MLNRACIMLHKGGYCASQLWYYVPLGVYYVQHGLYYAQHGMYYATQGVYYGSQSVYYELNNLRLPPPPQHQPDKWA